MPSSNCHSASEAFSISSNSRIESFSFSVCHWFSASWREQRMRFAMAQISRRRADQLGDLVRVLELRAVDLDQARGSPKSDFGHRLHYARFARTGRPQKQEVAHRTPWRIQPRQKHLVELGHLLYGRILADDLPPQSGLKILRFAATPRTDPMLRSVRSS